MQPILSLLLVALLSVPALAVDPPTYTAPATHFSWQANHTTMIVRDLGGGNYGGERFVVDENVVSPIYELFPNSTIRAAIAAKVDQQYVVCAALPVRGNPVDPKDTIIVVAQLPDLSPHIIPVVTRDVPVLVVDHGGGKFSGRVTIGGTEYTYPIYQLTSTGSPTRIAEALADKVDQIVTLRAVVCQHGSDRVFLAFDLVE